MILLGCRQTSRMRSSNAHKQSKGKLGRLTQERSSTVRQCDTASQRIRAVRNVCCEYEDFGCFRKGIGLTGRDQLGKGLLSYHHPVTRESSSSFPIAVLQPLMSLLRSASKYRLDGGVCHSNVLVSPHRTKSIPAALMCPHFTAHEECSAVFIRSLGSISMMSSTHLQPPVTEMFGRLHPQHQG